MGAFLQSGATEIGERRTPDRWGWGTGRGRAWRGRNM